MASRLNTMQQIIHILKVKKTWAAASNTESSLSRRVLSIGSCMKNFIKPEKKLLTLTWPGPESRLTTLVLLCRSKSKILPP